jgi:Fe-S-cluster-containing dehydrogenase component
MDFEGGVFPHVWAASFSIACNHCARPQCVPNCPVAAIKKDPQTGLVLQDQNMCIGCERCVTFCPYHAPSYIQEKMSTGKCSGCLNLAPEGSSPACVAACPLRALHFGDLDELRARFGGDDIGESTGDNGTGSDGTGEEADESTGCDGSVVVEGIKPNTLVSGFNGIPSPHLTEPSLLIRVKKEMMEL